MPRIGETTRLQRARAEWADFRAGFRRSKRGNLWRLWDGLTVCVFCRSDEYFGWSIAADDGPRFSTAGYESADEAIVALGKELGIGER
jgi:hypothetical protein